MTSVIAHTFKKADSSMMIRPLLILISATSFLVGCPVASATNGGTRVPLKATLRTCDFTPVISGPAQNNATASSVISSAGGTVTAEVHLANADSPGTHYEVRLIQAPRASNAPCDASGPGVAVGGLDSDGGGQATSTVQGSLQSGTTGVWVFILRPGQFSQSPAEFYTSDFVAPV